jgi:hypothetical protein
MSLSAISEVSALHIRVLHCCSHFTGNRFLDSENACLSCASDRAGLPYANNQSNGAGADNQDPKSEPAWGVGRATGVPPNATQVPLESPGESL